MTNETSQKKKSLCEKSMMLVANIIKLSSLSLGSTIYGTTFKQPPIDTVPATAKVPSANVSMLPQVLRSQRSQEPESNSKQYDSYFIELEKENSSHVICENNSSHVRTILMRELQTILRGHMKGTEMI
jgi:hypothetical protein